MTPPPPGAEALALPAPKDSIYNRDIMAVTKGFSLKWLALVLLALG